MSDSDGWGDDDVPEARAPTPPAPRIAAPPAERPGFGGLNRNVEDTTAPKPPGFGNSASSNSFGSNAAKPALQSSNGSSGFGSGTTTGLSNSGASTGFGKTQNAAGSGAFGSSNNADTASTGFGGKTTGSTGFGGSKPSTGFGETEASTGFGGKTERTGGFGNAGNSSGFGNSGESRSFGGNSGESRSFGGNPGERRGFGGNGEIKEKVCFNCQKPGHTNRECTEERKPRQPRGEGQESRGSGTGFGGQRSGGFGGGGETGFGSGGQTAFGSADNGNTFGSSRGGFGGEGGNEESRGPSKCYNCRQEGHRSNECPEPPRGCFNCGEQGHGSRECPNPRKEREPVEGEPKKATYVPQEDDVEAVFNMQKIKEGVLFDKFFDAKCEATAGGVKVKVTPVKNFKDIGLGERMLSNVMHAGYSKTTPIQQYAIPLVKQGDDIMACAQTGSGKTAAFLLPIMSKLIEESDLNTAGECGCYPRAIILTPTRELADQIYNEGRKFSYQTMCEIKPVYGGLAVGYNRGQIERGSTLIVGTVGRIKHFIEEGIIQLDKLKYFVLDEADRMIDSMGFGAEIEAIINSEGMPSKDKRQTIMFSATFPDSVQQAAAEFLKKNYTMITIDKIGIANRCVTQEFVQCERPDKKDKLLELLGVDMETYTTAIEAEVYTKKTIVFVGQRAMADTLAAILSSAQLPSITIHGAREQRERSEALRLFRSGQKPVLIATAVAERGLDIKGVDHVINYDLPDHIDDYIHRIGRTGRVGNSGRATSFYTEENSGILDDLIKNLVDAEQIVPDWMQGGHGAGGLGHVAQDDDEAW